MSGFFNLQKNLVRFAASLQVKWLRKSPRNQWYHFEPLASIFKFAHLTVHEKYGYIRIRYEKRLATRVVPTLCDAQIPVTCGVTRWIPPGLTTISCPLFRGRRVFQIRTYQATYNAAVSNARPGIRGRWTLKRGSPPPPPLFLVVNPIRLVAHTANTATLDPYSSYGPTTNIRSIFLCLAINA